MRVYLDNSATTRVDEEVMSKMLPYYTEIYGNPSSLHSFGREAVKAVDEARADIAAIIGAKPNEIYFTSGGTESDNWALKGTVATSKNKVKHIITTAIEHPAMLATCAELEKQGCRVTYLPVNSEGLVSVSDVENAICDDTVLISVMTANNEIGSIEPISEIGLIAKREGILFHTDAVQAMSSIPVNVNEMNVDMLSFSSHKFHGPKGIGILYIRSGVKIGKLIVGGHQERAYRAGTTNTPAIVGTAVALKKAVNNMTENNAKIKANRDYFVERTLKEIPFCQFNGGTEKRLVSNANLSFDYIEGESILMCLDLAGIAVSSGSACAAGSLEPSHVVLAIGQPIERAHSSIRFSFGVENTREETDYVIECLKETVAKLRAWSPLFNAKKGEGSYV